MVNLSPQAVEATRKYIKEEFGEKYLPAVARKYKAKSRLVQEAHEAIRPTNVKVDSSQLTVDSNDHRKLYDLIWKRMVVCQMAEAVVAETTVDVQAWGPVRTFPPASAQSDKGPNGDQKSVPDLRAVGSPSSSATPTTSYLLRANGQKVRFDGWYKVYKKYPISEQELPEIKKDEDLNLVDIKSEQKFTEPPARYSEATLIKDLEKHDIGRPSTYAPTISTLYERIYIEKTEDKKIKPTPIGEAVDDFLVKYFSEIVDLKFTAKMEGELDEIAGGKMEMAPTMKKFWEPFEKKVEKVF